MQYASQASYISNKPIRNDDPKARMIEMLKEQVRKLTEDLTKANETIDFLTKLTEKNQGDLKKNFESHNNPDGEGSLPEIRRSLNGIPRPDSAFSGDGRRSRGGGARAGSGFRESSRNSGRGGADTSMVEHRQIITQRIVKD